MTKYTKIPAATLNHLFALSGNCCSFPNCKQTLVTDDGVFVGELCHIEAPTPDGPRYNPDRDERERIAFDNLMLLCSKHHEIIDADLKEYTTGGLRAIKFQHESQFVEIGYRTPSEILAAVQQNYQELTPLPFNLRSTVGLEKKLEELEQYFQNENVVLLTGYAGAGKTTLARAFLKQYRDSFDSIGWIHCVASLRESLLTQLWPRFNIASDTPQAYGRLLHNLESLPGRKLLVIDDLKSEAEAQELQQKLQSFHLLLIARKKMSFKSLAFTPFAFETAKILFKKSYSKAIEDSFLRRLFSELHYNPILIEVFARISAAAETTTLELILSFFNAEQFVSGTGEAGLLFERIKTLQASLKCTVDEIRVLKRLAILPARKWSRQQLSELLGFIREEPESLGNRLERLVEQGWLMQSENEYQIPANIQGYFLSCDPPLLEVCRPTVKALARKLQTQEGENMSGKGEWAVIGAFILRNLSETDPTLATLSNNLATTHQARGDLEHALEFAEKTRAMAEQILAPEHPTLATTYNNLAMIYKDCGDSRQATGFMRKAIEILEFNFPQGHPNLEGARRNLRGILG